MEIMNFELLLEDSEIYQRITKITNESIYFSGARLPEGRDGKGTLREIPESERIF